MKTRSNSNPEQKQQNDTLYMFDIYQDHHHHHHHHHHHYYYYLYCKVKTNNNTMNNSYDTDYKVCILSQKPQYQKPNDIDQSITHIQIAITENTSSVRFL
jgi:hypothetical protein